MPYSEILSRAFEITRRHRVLWLFGFLVALTGGAGGFNGGGNVNFGNFQPFDGPGGPGAGPRFDPGAILPLLFFVIACLGLLGVVAIIVRYVVEVALVDATARADDGEVLTARAGFRRGWSRAAFFLFVNRVLLALPIFIIVIAVIVFAVVFGIGLGASFGGDDPSGFAIVGLVGFILLTLFGTLAMVFIVAIITAILGQWATREVVLRHAGPVQAVGDAWQLTRRHLKETVIFSLLMAAVGIGFSTILIPISLVAFAVIFGPVYLTYQATESLVPALVVAVPLGLLILIALSAVSGLYTAFTTTAWTLAWRHLRGISPAPAGAPAPLPSDGEGPLLATV